MKNQVTKMIKKATAKPAVKSTTKSNSTKKKVVATKETVKPIAKVKTRSNVLLLDKPTTIKYGKFTVKIGKNGVTLV
jgi:hypothetical protein